MVRGGGGFDGCVPMMGSSSTGGSDVLEHWEANRGCGVVQKRRTKVARWSSLREGRNDGGGGFDFRWCGDGAGGRSR
jgi:hypothetical protein